MSVARRLTASFGAVLLGPAVTLLVQIVNVPVMLRVWGPALYGEWLMLSAIPSYLLLTDLGFGNVAGSDMTMRVSADDHEGALETFHSSIALVGLVTLALLLLLVALFFTVPMHRLLHLSAMSPGEVQLTLLLLSVNSLIVLQWGVLMAPFRSTGRYATGMFAVNCIRIAEAAGFLIIVVRHTRPVGLAAFMLMISVAGTLWLMLLHRAGAKRLPIGLRAASRSRIRELSAPAFAFLAFPLGASVSTQGMTIIAGITLGPLAVAAFNPMRTLSRLALQLTDTVKVSFWPELSAAFGARDLPLARRLHRIAIQLSIVLAGVSLLFLFGAGPRLFALWTHGRIPFYAPVFNLLLLTGFANALWNASSAVPVAANRHRRLSLLYVAFSLLSIGVAYELSTRFGLPGIAAGMLFLDSCMAVAVVPISTGILEERPGTLLRAVLDPRSAMESVKQVGRRFAPKIFGQA